MRYFTPELYRKMQHSHDTPDFMRRWDEACRRAEQERETARPFLSEDMAYYVDLGWHDARIDGIRADGDTVRFRFDGEAADVELVFRGVRKLEKRIESEEICGCTTSSAAWRTAALSGGSWWTAAKLPSGLHAWRRR